MASQVSVAGSTATATDDASKGPVGGNDTLRAPRGDFVVLVQEGVADLKNGEKGRMWCFSWDFLVGNWCFYVCFHFFHGIWDGKIIRIWWENHGKSRDFGGKFMEHDGV